MNYVSTDTPLYDLLKAGKQLRLPKGQILGTFEDRPMLHLIKEGYIKRYLITKDGTKAIQVMYGPDEIFPLTPVYKEIFHMDIYRGPETYYYEAMTNLVVCSVSLDNLKNAVSENPAIYKDLFYAAGLRLNSYIQRLENMSLRVANRKVAYQLIYLATKFGKETPEGITIVLPVTHQTLAEILNLARETVTHCLIRLQEKGIVGSIGKSLTVVDMERLKHEVHL